jgi:predicted O-methyltransferase YrrM
MVRLPSANFRARSARQAPDAPPRVPDARNADARSADAEADAPEADAPAAGARDAEVRDAGPARSPRQRLRRLPGAVSRALAGPAAVVCVAVGWVLTVLLLVVAATDATTILLCTVVAVSIIAMLRSHRQLSGLHGRIGQGQERIRRMERQLGQTQRTLEKLASARNDALAKQLSQTTTKAVKQGVEGLRRSMVREVTTAYHELEALQNLYAMVPVGRRVPPLRGWAASPDLLLLLVELLRAERPRLMVECGSGASTLWAALAIRRFGLDTRVVALEHDAAYAQQTTELLAAHGVAGLAEVRHAPLEPVELDGQTWQWYSRDGWADLEGIGLLFVDGPPGKTGPHARYPALPVLGGRLAGDALIVLDDLIRVEEQEIVERWLAADPTVTERRIKLEKDASLLRRRAAGPWVGSPRPQRDGQDAPRDGQADGRKPTGGGGGVGAGLGTGRVNGRGKP